MRMTADMAEKANSEWGFNCGPGALCAVLDKTPDEIRPHLGDFEQKRYTNPTLMKSMLNNLGVPFRSTHQSEAGDGMPVLWPELPQFGLVRIQWAGPWTKPGVPIAARYRHTHWVACWKTIRRDAPNGRHCEIFDINAMQYGGWLPYAEWKAELVPWLLTNSVARASGEWWPTHCWEVKCPFPVAMDF